MARKKKRKIKIEIPRKASFYEMPMLKLAAIVFIISLSIRILLDLIFFLRYGWHASNVPEVWYYLGVAKGIFDLKSMDPTLWILRALGMILTEQILFYGVILTAGILSSLTSVSIFFLGNELDSKKTGFYAGILYATMLQPLGLSVVSFTHNLVQLPIIVLSILIVIQISKAEGIQKLLNLSLLTVLIILGWQVNPLITIAIDVAILFLGLQLFNFLGKKKKIDRQRIYPYYLALLTLAILVLRIGFLPEIFKQVFQTMPQGRLGSIDIIPISLGSLWIRYNFLIIFIPLGLLSSFRKRNITVYSLFLIGFIISTLVDRGSRVLDLGVSFLAAYSFSNWKNKDAKKLDLGLFLFLALIMYFIRLSLFLNLFFLLMGTSLYLLVKSEKQSNEFPSIFLSLVIIGGAITLNWSVSPNFIKETATTDAEYRGLEYLRGMVTGEEMIYTNWVNGYFVEVVSGLKPASSPRKIDTEIYKALWMPDDKSAEKFRQKHIEYILVSTRDFEIIGVDLNQDLVTYKVSKGIIYKPNSNRLSILRETSLYKMIYQDEELKNFEKVYEEEDKTGLIVKIYRVK